METRNAIIRSVRLGFEDHGILTAWLDLDYGSVCQGFGGWNLQAIGANYCGEFVKGCLNVVGVNEWGDLPGKTIRVRQEHEHCHSIGHIVEDRWFNPRDLFTKMEADTNQAA